MAAAKKVVVATENFVVSLDGEELFVHAGDEYQADDPIVRGREHLFAPAANEAASKK